MSKILIIGTEEFEFPIQGSNPDYGEQVTDWAEAVTDALATVQQPNDILPTTAAINNNQSSFTNIPGFSFDTSEVIAINAEYIINRSTTLPAQKVTENGKIEGNFDGSSWRISHTHDGEAGIELDINSSGQVQYKSDDLAGSGYQGEIIFKAKVFNQDS